MLVSAALIYTLEFTCFFLNRSRWKKTFASTASWKLPKHAVNAAFPAAYDIPTTFLPMTNPAPLSPPLIDKQVVDYSARYPVGYHETAASGVTVPRASSRWRSTIRESSTGLPIYDVHLSFDENRRRVTWHDRSRNRFHLLTLGCSFAFGEGVEDDETLASRLARISKDFRAYNLALNAYGPNDLMLRAETADYWDEIAPSGGLAIYVYFWGHVDRVVGKMRDFGWQQGKPHYALTDGKLRRVGILADAHPLLSLAHGFIAQTEIVRFFHIEYPTLLSADKLDLTAAILQGIKDKYLERFPEGKFVVLLYPTIFAEGTRAIRPFLDRYQISYLDYTRLPLSRYSNEPVYHRLDGHPNANSYRIIAAQIAKDLGFNSEAWRSLVR